MEKYIVVMDSGIGGASILKEIRNLLPNQKYIYFADTRNAPYGNKTKNKILEIVVKRVEKLNRKKQIGVLVLACNTASCVCSKLLRQTFSFPIVCVEPPIKKAVEQGYKNIVVLATPQTLKTNEIVNQYSKNPNLKIEKVSPKNLASIIDSNLKNLSVAEKTIIESLETKEFDAVVLGCTHYHFVKENISKVFKKPVISCEKEVANQVEKIVKIENLPKTKAKLKIKLSKFNRRIFNFLKIYLKT